MIVEQKSILNDLKIEKGLVHQVVSTVTHKIMISDSAKDKYCFDASTVVKFNSGRMMWLYTYLVISRKHCPAYKDIMCCSKKMHIIEQEEYLKKDNFAISFKKY